MYPQDQEVPKFVSGKFTSNKFKMLATFNFIHKRNFLQTFFTNETKTKFLGCLLPAEVIM